MLENLLRPDGKSVDEVTKLFLQKRELQATSRETTDIENAAAASEECQKDCK